MNESNNAPIDDSVTDVEVKPDFKQRQQQRLMRALQTTLDFFEHVVEFASPKSAVNTTASSSTHDLHVPLRARWSIRVMVGGILLLLLWASVGKIDQVTRAQAQIIASERTQLVQSSDGGVLTQLHVREGDVVKAGQLLATLQKERAAAAVSDSRAKVAALSITLARLHAEVYGKPLAFDKELLVYTDYIRNQTDLYNKRQTAFKDDIHAMQAILALGEDELRINSQLEASGDVSRAEILRLQRSVADIRAQLASKRNKYFQDAQAEMTKAQEELSTQSEQLRDRSQVLEHTELVAPVDAVVNNIKVSTVGGVVRAGDTVMELLPTGDNLIAEAKIPPADIAFVAIGQDASVKLDAYDSSIFGGLRGKVSYISSDVLTEETRQGLFMYYRVRIRITGAEFKGDKANEIHMRPGLTASVEIKAMERTVLSYLTKPISKTFSQSMGER
jgi:membrane fusion protein, adhesin transport system